MYPVVFQQRLTLLDDGHFGGDAAWPLVFERAVDDLAGLACTALTFTFTGGTTLQPGERKLIVANLAAFQSRYPGITPLGVFEGTLANEGERIRLVGKFGETIQSFSYSDGWYDHTDGEGFSLVATDTNQTLSLFDAKEGWKASASLNGDPGSFVASLDPKSIAINEVLANTATPNQTWIELKNTTGQDIDISGWFLSDSDLDLKKYKLRGTVIQDGQFLLLNEQTSYGQLGGAGVNTLFTLGANGGTIYLSSADGAEALLGYREEQDYAAAFVGQSVGRYIKSNGTAGLSAPDNGDARRRERRCRSSARSSSARSTTARRASVRSSSSCAVRPARRSTCSIRSIPPTRGGSAPV